MPRIKTIEIDEEKCTGCGECVSACHEGVIALQNGKARVMREASCDGLGNCIPVCSQGAIRFIEKEVAGCPHAHQESLRWPVKLRLVSPLQKWEGEDLVLAADCSAFVTPDFQGLTRGRRVLIGCPKFDDLRIYQEKLREILNRGKPRSLEVIHMEVPCCFGLWSLAESLVRELGEPLALSRTVLRVTGEVKEGQ
jgi:NAD-dependent dihydropyrimidine dehydrogenase PreA subunit